MKIIYLVLLFFCFVSYGQTNTILTNSGGVVTLTNGGSPLVLSTPTTANAINITDFIDFKPDLTELTGITIVGNTISADAAFTAQDIDKIVVVKNARSYPAYRKAPMTLTARVMAVSGGNATISILDGVGNITNCSNQTGWKATDNFDVMQKVIDTCASRGVSILNMNYNGTAYLVPTLSARTRPAVNLSSLIVNNTLQIIGIDSGATKLKFGMEDIQTVDVGLMQKYDAFYVNSCTFKLKNITIFSADRTSTRNDHQEVFCIYGNPDSKIGQNIFIENSSIRNNIHGYYQDAKLGSTNQGWGIAVYMNGSIPASGDTAKMEILNSFIQAQAGPSYFAHSFDGNDYNDTLNRFLRIWNSKVIAGAAYERKYPNISIKTSSDTIKVSDPEFSWYDFNDYEGSGSNTRRPVIAILRHSYIYKDGPGEGNGGFGLSGDSLFWTKIKTVINDSMAVFCTTTDDGNKSFVSFDSGIPYGFPSWNSNINTSVYLMRSVKRQGAFHATYVSGNVGRDIQTMLSGSLRYGGNRQGGGWPICINVLTNVTKVYSDSNIGLELLNIGFGWNASQYYFYGNQGSEFL